MTKDRTQLIRKLYISSIIFLFIGLVYSKLAISLAQFYMLGVWLIDKNFNEKLTRLKQNIPAIIFMSIFACFLIGLAWSSNIRYGLKEVKLLLPVLVIPFMVVSFKPFTKKELKLILLLFSFIIFSKTFHSLFLQIYNEYINPQAPLRIKVSHIRLALMIDLSIFSLFYLYKNNYFKKNTHKIIVIISIIWLIISLFLTLSLTGVIIFIFIMIIIIFKYFRESKNIGIKIVFFSLTVLIPLSLIAYVLVEYRKFHDFKDPTFGALPQYTQSGNEYVHDSTSYFIENGYNVGYYFCEKELIKQWNAVATIKYNQINNNGYQLKHSLIRYLTSLGLPKDSVGVSKLTEKDIKNIEKGINNYRLTNKFDISNRIYNIIWQFHVYKYSHDANNQSITQRLEFLKTAIHIIKKNIYFGVGTGDMIDAFESQYELDNSKLTIENRHITHNQYITFLVMFGLILGLWCILAIFIPFFMNKKYKEFLPSIFFIIITMSMLNEDTLESSLGISFFALFYSILLLQTTQKINSK